MNAIITGATAAAVAASKPARAGSRPRDAAKIAALIAKRRKLVRAQWDALEAYDDAEEALPEWAKGDPTPSDAMPGYRAWLEWLPIKPRIGGAFELAERAGAPWRRRRLLVCHDLVRRFAEERRGAATTAAERTRIDDLERQQLAWVSRYQAGWAAAMWDTGIPDLEAQIEVAWKAHKTAEEAFYALPSEARTQMQWGQLLDLCRAQDELRDLLKEARLSKLPLAPPFAHGLPEIDDSMPGHAEFLSIFRPAAARLGLRDLIELRKHLETIAATAEERRQVRAEHVDRLRWWRAERRRQDVAREAAGLTALHAACLRAADELAACEAAIVDHPVSTLAGLATRLRWAVQETFTEVSDDGAVRPDGEEEERLLAVLAGLDALAAEGVVLART